MSIREHGLVDAYIHGDGRIGVLIEVRCDTDFLARSDDFKRLVRDLELQIAASSPAYVSPDDVPKELIDQTSAAARQWAVESGKPDRVVDQIITGRVQKLLREQCLLAQAWVRDPKMRVGELVRALAAASGERIRVVGFARYELPLPPANAQAIAFAKGFVR